MPENSLRSALSILEYSDVYHGFVITAHQREDCAFWVPLMRQKLSGSKLPESIDFDSVLANCEAVTDGPANVFAEELLSFYPDAKVILNRRRDVDACICWLWWNFELVMKGYYNGDFDRNGKSVFKEHYEQLEKRLTNDKRPYLEWSVEDGWEPLCEFLGKPIPDAPFPNGNKGSGQFQDNMEEATKDLVRNAMRNMAISSVFLASFVVRVMALFKSYATHG
ncbi:hypothetical protein NM208_g13061 [Fusarium decemcellulare]|uniref:Uncharacterized protein n=1 Tax=Fusarium decemcellulare TaxID=57161 RepID=A0ACC1RL92_9HYPO|nr:hypothetical protein NM208_g13061 [Fusarium decemcellulare]